MPVYRNLRANQRSSAIGVCACVGVWLLSLWAGLARADDLEAFSFDSARLPVSTVYHYEKRTLSGDRFLGTIDLYVDEAGNLQALKTFDGEPHPLLVAAGMDWALFSAVRFEAFRLPLTENSVPTAVAYVDRDKNELITRIGSETKAISIGSYPVHVHDFELMSLGLAIRFLKRPAGEFAFDLIGLPSTPNETIPFVDRGAIRVKHEKDLPCGEKKMCTEYIMRWRESGAYFGRILLDATSMDMVSVETVEPDEAGIPDMRLDLVGTERTTPAWQKAGKLRPQKNDHP